MTRPGRPEVGPRLEVRVTEAQLAKLHRVAKAKERPVAWVVRSLIDRLEDVE